MASETQYYQGKVFLKAYNDALQTLDEIHQNNALLHKNLAYRDFVVSGFQKGQISIKNGGIIKQKNFQNSKIKSLGVFSASNFAKDLTRFQSAQTFSQLTAMLQQKAQ